MKQIEIATWFDNLSDAAQKDYLKNHPDSKLLPSNKLKEHHESAKDIEKYRKAHINQMSNARSTSEVNKHRENLKNLNEELKPHLNAIHEHNKEQHEKQGEHNVKTGKTNQEQQDKINKSWGKPSDLKQNAQLLLNEIADAEKKFRIAHDSGDTDKAIELRRAINLYKDGYKKLTGKEYFRHHELSKLSITRFKEIASDWWDSLSTENQEAYIRTHPNSIYAGKVQKEKLANIDVKLDPKKLREHLDTESDKSKTRQAIGDTFNDAELRIQKHRLGK